MARVIRTRLVGTLGSNADGTLRQDVIRGVASPGVVLALTEELDHPEFGHAVAVSASSGGWKKHQLGYLAPTAAAESLRHLRDGGTIRATIVEVAPDSDGGALGVGVELGFQNRAQGVATAATVATGGLKSGFEKVKAGLESEKGRQIQAELAHAAKEHVKDVTKSAVQRAVTMGCLGVFGLIALVIVLASVLRR